MCRSSLFAVCGVLLVSVLWAHAAAPAAAVPSSGPAGRLNVLLITADDMDFHSLGVCGNKTPDITPHLDKLAAEGMRFTHAHVTVAVCQPSREVLMTGRYPHRNGGMGFEPIHRDVPTLQESLRQAGYLNGIFAKVIHLAPEDKFCWDTIVHPEELGQGRSPELYYEHAKRFFEGAKAAGRPFFLMANSHDPHRPFAGSDGEQDRAERRAKRKNRVAVGGFPPADRYYRPDEVDMPGFLPDLPNVRKEVAQYYSSVHRCDQTVGEVLRALEETGFADNTLVMFLSDNGMAFPFAKTNCYRASTRMPWIVRWPGKTRAGRVEEEHMISGIDFMPTILEATGLAPVSGVDGRSFVPVLCGERQADRDLVYTVFNRTSANNAYPMRSIQTRRWVYIFSPWSDGTTVFKNESQSGLTFAAMQRAAKDDEAVASRVELFVHRVPQEFYDYESDPFAMHNLIDEPKHRSEIERLRARMLDVMKASDDPLLETFRKHVEK
ncbi:MAG: sulfatase [Phycisphaerae bacterium]|nr:sulfatase [Phycisphaerae bacterium]